MKKENLKAWNNKDYESFIEKLLSKKDSKYRDFHKKLTTTKYEILGINVPECRKIAKEIAKSDIPSFLSQCKDKYYEEVLIEGFVIATLKDEEIFFKYFNLFLPKIDNWAICDGFCNSLKIVKMNPSKYFNFFLNLIDSKEPFTIRVGLITLLSFYVELEYLDRIYTKLNEIVSDHYYVNMGIAWLLAEIYTKYPNETDKYLKNAKINDFTMNKTISKIRDSYRITKEQKEDILKYRRTKKCQKENI